MNRIIDFLYRHLATVLFIILESLALLLLFDRNEFSRTVVAHHALTAQAHLAEVGTLIGDYFFLNVTNQSLSDENARLNAELSQYKAIIDSLTCDSVIIKQTPPEFAFTSARIIYVSLNQTNNYVIINKGSADGISENMGVIANGFAYGVVGTVSAHYSTVLLLINRSVNISAKLSDNDQIGIIGWDGDSKSRVTLDELPSHIRVSPGDSVLTSPFSTIFPENIFIGSVSRIKNSEVEGFSHIFIDLAVNYDAVRYVAVIRNVALPEYTPLIDEMNAVEQKESKNLNKDL